MDKQSPAKVQTLECLPAVFSGDVRSQNSPCSQGPIMTIVKNSEILPCMRISKRNAYIYWLMSRIADAVMLNFLPLGQFCIKIDVRKSLLAW